MTETESKTAGEELKFNQPGLALFGASFLSLFLELLLIRWLSSDFVLFGVFKTFPLVACFVGLGTGVAKADLKFFRLTPFALLVTVVTICLTSFAGYGYLAFPSLALYQWNELTNSMTLALEVLKMSLLLVLLLMGPFASMFCIGNLIGHCFNKSTALRAYCIDIAGAITGSITFALLSFLSFSPNLEIGFVIALMLAITVRFIGLTASGATIMTLAAVAVMLPIFNPPGTSWSPYYRLDVQEISLMPQLTKSGKKEDLGIILNTNRGFSQSFTNNNVVELSPEGEKVEAARFLKNFLLVRKKYYELPYSFHLGDAGRKDNLFKPKEILILGAGSGSDVAEAVRQGVNHIDAVEIDQSVIGLAKKYNQSYIAPQVKYHLDDGRRFMAGGDKKYDMVVLACLDSRAVSGSGSSLRTDCYIHTRESYQDCIRHLKPDGIMVLSFGASVGGSSNWLRNRIYKTLEDVTGYPPIVMSDENAKFNWPAYFFVTGKPVKDGLLQVEPLPAPTAGEKSEIGFAKIDMPKDVDGVVLGDDWPFLYVKDKALDLPYLFVLFLISAITIYVGRGLIFGTKTSTDLQLFFMGAAFILLELQAISRLALIYGATWVTSSVVINGVLLMILLANYMIIKRPHLLSQKAQYLALFASLLLSYLAPVGYRQLTSVNPDLAACAITIVTLAPIFLAGLIFATAFKGAEKPSRSFAFNLLGSVLGGLLEYLSTYLGISNLLLVALLLYVFSFCYMLKVKPETAS